MATETKDRTKDQVKALHAEGKSAKEIAEALGKTPATIYNHLRGLGLGQGKRGRPRKTDAEKAEGSKTPVTPRPRRGSKGKPGPKASTPSTNGHDASVADRFPKIKAAV